MIEIKDYFGMKLQFGESSLLSSEVSSGEQGGFCDGSFFAVVRCSGADVQNYLNGQTSNQLNALKSGDGHATSFNTPKGKTIALMDIFRFENDYFLIFSAKANKPVLETLDMYLFAEDVNLEPQDSKNSLLVLGLEQCNMISDRLGFDSSSEFAVESIEDGYIFKGYFGKLPYLLISGSLVKSKLNDKPILMSRDDLELLRIKNLYPLPGVEYQTDKILTPELDQTHRINYQKGCFVGQEVFARLRTYGRTNKVLAAICLKQYNEPLDSLVDQVVSIDEKSKGNVLACVNFRDEIYLTAYVPTALKNLGDEVRVGDYTGILIA